MSEVIDNKGKDNEVGDHHLTKKFNILDRVGPLLNDGARESRPFKKAVNHFVNYHY